MIRDEHIMRKFAIDLTWVCHKKNGGTESYIRNILDGMCELEGNFRAILLLTKDNYESFQKYNSYPCFELVLCNTVSARRIRRVLWQNTKMGKQIKAKGIDVCFEPVYGKPFFGTRGIRFYTTIHDLQAYHFPEYFSRMRVWWMKLSWWNAVRTSEKVIAISDFVRQDIMKHYPCNKGKIVVIHNAINISEKKKRTDLAC